MMVAITCPTCFEEFEVAAPALSEVPTKWDYDCEVCCRPMDILFEEEDGEVVGYAVGLED
jgi:Cysteine-rich CPXCG